MLLFGMFAGMPLDRNKQMHAISLPPPITYIAIVVASCVPHFTVDFSFDDKMPRLAIVHCDIDADETEWK